MARDTLLFRRDEARQAGRLVVQSQVRRDLRAALDALVPGERVWIFGSLTQPGRFNDASDVDVALEAEPAVMSAGRLSSELSERLARPVDVVLLESMSRRLEACDPAAQLIEHARSQQKRVEELHVVRAGI